MRVNIPEKMADAEAIREARRRRILQSSESRLNRVTGRIGHDGNTRPETGDKSHTESIAANNVSDNTTITENLTVLRQRQIPTTDSSDQTTVQKCTVKVSSIKKPAVTQNSTVTPSECLNSSRSSSDAKMILKHFEFLRIVMCVMVAYLCRRVLSTGYGIFYFQSVVLPFACMEATFFMFKHKVLHNVTLPHKSSMLIGLLMLCGIRPDILQMYNKLMGYVTAASEDFAMFFFAFMMANMVMS